MMENKQNDRQLLDSLYRSLVFLLNFFVVIVVCILSYFLFGDHIAEWMKPRAKTVVASTSKPESATEDRVENGKDLMSGLIAASGYKTVRSNCTACHSAQLITQNRASRDGWKAMIKWMQATQGLWDLGENEAIILDYLAANYAPQEVGRRAPLEEVEYYILELE